MRNYVTSSLEVHLFFGRIMKEHSLFLMAGFPSGEKEMISRADWFRQEFEKALEMAVQLADGRISGDVLRSGEIVTEFTEMAECQTQRLSGIPIDMDITRAEENLRGGMWDNSRNEMWNDSRERMCGNCRKEMWNDSRGRMCGNSGNEMKDSFCRQTVMQVNNLNRRILSLLNGLISFKERVLQEVLSCRLYTTNYPLLLEHIIREAKLYRLFVSELVQKGRLPVQDMREVELFWNQIMMEHAQFIRGLLDPTECALMETADGFADDYCRLLEEARRQDSCACEGMMENSLELTEKYQAFKTAGVKGITGCDIRSLIIPLLADHVLREANHYLRLLKTGERW